MNDWFSSINAQNHLSPSAVKSLHEDGFVVMPGVVPEQDLTGLLHSYDQVVQNADAGDISVGGSTTRVSDLVNRSAVFDNLYLYPPMLDACCRIIGQPFKLSTMHARTLRPPSVA